MRLRILSGRLQTSALILGLITIVVAGIGCAGSRPGTKGGKHVQSEDDDRVDPIAFQHFSVGTIAMAEGDLPAAVGHFERALRFDPGSYEIRMALAETYFRMRDLPRAISVAEVVQPQDIKVLEFLGKCYRYSGREDEAERSYREIVALDSTNAAAYWYLSRFALKTGRLAEGADYLEHAARVRHDPRGFSEVGDIYTRLGLHEDALRAYQASIDRDSSAANREALIGKAEALESLQRRPEAAETYRKALRQAPDDVGLRQRLINHYLFTEDIEHAITEIKRLLEYEPDNPERLRLGMLWFEIGDTTRAESLFTALDTLTGHYLPPLYLGRIAYERGDYATAKAHFHRAIAINDSVPDAWIHLLNTIIEDDSIGAAVALVNDTTLVLSRPKPVWYFIGITYSRRQEYDSALAWLARAYALDSSDTRIQFSLASALERSGRFGESAEMFQALLEREPNNAQALNYLGYMYADSGIRLEESLRLIEQALTLEPANGAYLDSYGWVLYRLGRYDEAETQIRKALDVLDSDPTIIEHLGDILTAKGHEKEAREQWRKALELDPDNPVLQSKLE